MFEVAIQFMIQLISLLPGIIGLWLLFDLIGSLIFKQ